MNPKDVPSGGPAFPHVIRNDADAVEFGMTLRDYFAAQALQALIGHEGKEDYKRGAKGVPLMAAYAYEYADAMVAARGAA